MANNYAQFSENIFFDLTPEEIAWLNKVGRLDEEDEDDVKVLDEVFPCRDVDMSVPGCDWMVTKENSLWCYSEEHYSELNVALFLQTFIKTFRPDAIVSITSASYCSRLRENEFGGVWMVVSADEIRTGSTWDMIETIVEELQKKQEEGVKQ
jgi:hypothetical protein